MTENEDETLESIKISLLGNSGVGKTCIIKRYSENIYEENSKSNCASYSQKLLKINDKEIQLDIWDTAGQEKYRSMGRRFYKGSNIVLLVYDITCLESFNDLKEIWYNELKTYGEKYTVVAIVGNKSDCYEDEKVKDADAQQFADSINATFMLTSAKKGDNIDVLFETLVRQYLGPEFLKKVNELKKDKGEVVKVTKDSYKKKKKKKKFC